MSYGFVYVLSNIAMPGIYKVGRTAGSPTARARALSSATGVPFPFSVVCYCEVSNSAAAEAGVHEFLHRSRVNESREFFRAPIEEIAQILRESAYRQSFCDIEINVAKWDEGTEERPARTPLPAGFKGFE